MAEKRSFPREYYRVAWFNSLGLEFGNAKAMLDEIHGPPIPPVEDDTNVYGSINGHNIVVVSLSEYGITPAARAGSQVKERFPSIVRGLLVGVGGGVPSTRDDVRLGDVVVSKPKDGYPGVIQYDLGKELPENFLQTGSLNKPDPILLQAANQLEAANMSEDHKVSVSLSKRIQIEFPNQPSMMLENLEDCLYNASYTHRDPDGDCGPCDKREVMRRSESLRPRPKIHYGLIGSGNRVIRDAAFRDKTAKRLGILCFEMEAAGLMDSLPCIVIRGICDYCDSHKVKNCQLYAGAVAAAYAKELLCTIQSGQQDPLPMDSDLRRSITLPRAMLPGSISSHEYSGSYSSRDGRYAVSRTLRFIPNLSRKIYPCRTMELDQIRCQSQLTPGADGIAICTLHGLGGVGKSLVALEYAHKNVMHFDIVYWLSAEEANLRRSWDLFSQSLKKRFELNSFEDPTEWLENSEKTWLLIFDNVENVSHFDSIIPKSCRNRGTIVITTRRNISDQLILEGYCLNSSILIRPLSPALGGDALRYMLESYSDTSVKIEFEGQDNGIVSQHVSQRLGGIPALLEQAARYMGDRLVTPEQFLKNFDSFSTEWLTSTPYKRLTQEIVLRIEDLNDLPDDVANFVKVISLFQSDSLERWLVSAYFARGLSPRRPSGVSSDPIDHSVLRKLRELDFIVQESPKFLILNPAVQDSVLRILVQHKEGTENCLDIAFEMIRGVVGKYGPDALSYQQPFLPSTCIPIGFLASCLIGLWKTSKAIDTSGKNSFWDLMYDVSFYLWNTHSNLNMAVDVANAALEAVKDANLDPAYHCAFHSYVKTLLGRLHVESGYSSQSKAHGHFFEALELRKEANGLTGSGNLGRGHEIELLTCKVDLATSLLDRNQVTEAYNLYVTCIATYKRWTDYDAKLSIPYDWGRACIGVAFCQILWDNLGEASKYAEQARRAMSSKGINLLTTSLDYLQACVLTQCERYDAALQFHVQSRDARKEIYGEKHYLTAQSDYAIGALQATIGDHAAAAASMRKSILKDAWQPDESRERAEIHLSIVISQISEAKEGITTSTVERALLPLDRMHPTFEGRFARKLDITSLKIFR